MSDAEIPIWAVRLTALVLAVVCAGHGYLAWRIRYADLTGIVDRFMLGVAMGVAAVGCVMMAGLMVAL